MAQFSTTIDIAAPPARVWDVMRDVERWPEWTGSVRSLHLLDDKGPLRIGSRARIRQPRLAPATLEVTELDDGKCFTWVTRSLGVRATAHHGIEPIQSGSRVTLSVHFDGPLGPLAGWVAGGLTRRYLDMEAAGLKRRSEEGLEHA